MDTNTTPNILYSFKRNKASPDLQFTEERSKTAREVFSPTGGVQSFLTLLQVLDVFLSQLTGRLPALRAVWSVQFETEPPFPDLECEAAVLIIIHQPALGRVLCRILAQSPFQ